MARIEGLAETMALLKKFEPEAYKEMQKRMKSDAKPMLQDAKSRLPQMPLSNWKPSSGAQADANGYVRSGASRLPSYQVGVARKKLKLSLTNKKNRGRDGRRVVLRMVSNDAAANVFDWAGIASSSTFSSNLTREFGAPMRAVWPAADAHKSDVVKSIESALREQEKKTNRKLR